MDRFYVREPGIKLNGMDNRLPWTEHNRKMVHTKDKSCVGEQKKRRKEYHNRETFTIIEDGGMVWAAPLRMCKAYSHD